MRLLDFDDQIIERGVHPSSTVFPVVLALGLSSCGDDEGGESGAAGGLDAVSIEGDLGKALYDYVGTENLEEQPVGLGPIDEDVRFDHGAATRLIGLCNSAAASIEGQAGSRASWATRSSG